MLHLGTKIISLLRLTYVECRKDDVYTLSAALAFYFIFSLGPVIYLIAWIASLLVPDDIGMLIGTTLRGMEEFIGPKGIEQIEALVENALISKTGWFFKLAGFPIIVLIACGTFISLQKSINKIWEIPPRKEGWLLFLKRRMLAFGVICILAMLLISFIVADATIRILETQIDYYIPKLHFLIPYFNSYGLEYLFLLIIVFLFLKILPDGHIYWKDLLVGSAFTAFLFLMGKHIFSFYLGHTYFGNIYDAIGNVILVLVWFYYNAMIFYIGAEFTHAYAILYGRGIIHHKDSLST